MMQFFQKIIDIVLPPRCLLCGKIISGENGLCAECFSKINFISYPICKRCGYPISNGFEGMNCPNCINNTKSPFSMQRAMVYYDENTRPLITNFKFRDKTENASFLAKWLYAAGQDIWQQGADLLVPVPLHAKRLRHRKFNQSALMCKELSRLTGIPVEYNSLVRSINTKPQVECSGHTRISNIKGAFKVTNTKAFEGKRIVIIDDVITTGSTLQECGLEIKKSGASEVNALVVARVIK